MTERRGRQVSEVVASAALADAQQVVEEKPLSLDILCSRHRLCCSGLSTHASRAAHRPWWWTPVEVQGSIYSVFLGFVKLFFSAKSIFYKAMMMNHSNGYHLLQALNCPACRWPLPGPAPHGRAAPGFRPPPCFLQDVLQPLCKYYFS